jgi:hypothetical protein
MAKKKTPKQPFYVEGMTVKEILNISPDQLAKLNKRDISRALRTVSLAANKRINRLKSKATKTKEGYVPKKKGSQINTSALNWVTDDGHKRTQFGVKKTSTRNEMLKQLSKIKQFMDMKTSTVTGAVDVRKNIEKKIFGKTREQAARGVRTKKAKAEIFARYENMSKEVWANYRKFLEIKGRDPHSYMSGSDTIIELIGQKVLSGADEEETINAALDKFKGDYEEEQEEYNKIFNNPDYWTSDNV